MKLKLLLLIIASSLITYFIYNKYYHMEINITSINSFATENNVNEYISSEISNNNLNYKLNVDYSSPYLEIENLIAAINNNTNKIQNIIHDSEVIIISLGNIDMLTETNQNILKEYNILFPLLRKYNTKEIIFLSPISFKDVVSIKSICQKHNIRLINTSSYLNEYSSPDSLNKDDSLKLAKIIIKNIAY